MATMESWVEVGAQSFFKFICIGDWMYLFWRWCWEKGISIEHASQTK
jgi:hypothetical protein